MKISFKIALQFLFAFLTFTLSANDTISAKNKTVVIEVGDTFIYKTSIFKTEYDVPYTSKLLEYKNEYFSRYIYRFKLLEIENESGIFELQIQSVMRHQREKQIGRNYWEEKLYENSLFSADDKRSFIEHTSSSNNERKASFLESDKIKLSFSQNSYNHVVKKFKKSFFLISKVEQLALENLLQKLSTFIQVNENNISILLPDNISRNSSKSNSKYAGYFNGSKSIYDSVTRYERRFENSKLIHSFDTVVENINKELQYQANIEKIENPNARIRGKLEGFDTNTISLHYKNPYIKFERFQYITNSKLYNLSINEQNEFEFYLNIENLQEYNLSIGDKYFQLFIEPGDDLYLVAKNGKSIENFYWYGKGSEKNQYLIKQKLFSEKHIKPGSLSDRGKYANWDYYKLRDKYTHYKYTLLRNYLDEHIKQLPVEAYVRLKNEFEIAENIKKYENYSDWYYKSNGSTVRLYLPKYLNNFHIENSLYMEASNFPRFLYTEKESFKYNPEPGTLQDYVLRFMRISMHSSRIIHMNDQEEKLNFIEEYTNTGFSKLINGEIKRIQQSTKGHKPKSLTLVNCQDEELCITKPTDKKGNVIFIIENYIEEKEWFLKTYKTIQSTIKNKKYNFYIILENKYIKKSDENNSSVSYKKNSTAQQNEEYKKWLNENNIAHNVFIPTADEKSKIDYVLNIPFHRNTNIVIDKNGYITFREIETKRKGNRFSYIDVVSEFNSLKPYKSAKKKKRQQFFLISFLSAFSIAVLTSWLITRSRQRKKLRKKEIENRMQELELKALRSQMNPHFLFNALASVQNLVSKEQNESALKYLADFGELVRRTLNNTDKEEITLQEELKAVEIYIELEKIRSEFDFTIRVSNAVDTNNTYVPPMILQPFVENALLHGLLPKELDDRKLAIKVSEKEKNLQIIVDDNGIGRAAAKKIEKKKNGKAIKLLKERISILSEKSNENYNIEIVDKYKNGSPQGTKVIITLPND